MTLEKITESLKNKININFINVNDHSDLHFSSKKSLTHLEILIISNDFFNKNWIDRHRIIFKWIKKILKKQIYSITLYTYTVLEWKNKKNINNIPPKCIQKNKNKK